MPRKYTYYGSLPIDLMAQAFFDASESGGFTITAPYAARYNNFYTHLRASGELTNLEFLVVDAAIDTDIPEAGRKGIVLRDLIDPSLVSVIESGTDFTGSHIGGVGFTGTGSFGIVNKFNPSTATKWSQNSATYGVLTLSSVTDPGYSIVCADGAFSNAGLFLGTSTIGAIVANEAVASLGSYSFHIYPANSIQWRRGVRSASNVSKEYTNGVLTGESIAVSTALVNSKTGRFGAYGGNAWTGGFYSTTPQGAFYGGNKNLNGDVIEHLINTYLLRPIGKKSYFNKLLFQVGDSIFSSHSDGLFSRMVNKTVDDLNNNWTVTNLAYPGKFAYDIDSEFAVRMAPYYSAYYDKNIFYLAAGRNDIRLSSQTGANVYTSIKSICQKARAAGWQKIVVSGLLPIEWVGNQAFADTALLDYHTLMFADCPTPHGSVANAYLPGAGVTWIDMFLNPGADPALSNYAGTAYQPDHTHMTNLGADTYSTNIQQPVLLVI